jgi:hypothetical protein
LIPYALEEIWGYVIKTTNGEVSILMKIIHNGCYDGGLCVENFSEECVNNQQLKSLACISTVWIQ